MVSWIDPALYPDQETPERLDSLADRVDFLVRLCGAWDFGRLPEMATVREVRQPEWREAVAGAEILTSPTYHLLRDWHGLPERPFLGRKLAWICQDPSFEFV